MIAGSPNKFDVRKPVHWIGARRAAFKSLPTIEGSCFGVLLKRCQNQSRWAKALGVVDEHLSYPHALMLGRDKDLFQRGLFDIDGDEADYISVENGDTTDVRSENVVSQTREPRFIWHWM
jgi:hypothetical protein